MHTVSAILALVLILVIHEGGHFVGARFAGMRILEVALGWGKRIVSVRRDETDYSINAIPLLAYVAVDPGEPGSNDPEIYRNRPVWGRILYVLGGPVGNMVFAALLLVGLVAVQGVPHIAVYVSAVEEGRPAAFAGIAKGDRILSINGMAIDALTDISPAMEGTVGRPVPFRVLRADREISLHVVPHTDLHGQPRIGIAMETRATFGTGEGSLWERVQTGWRYFVGLTRQVTAAYVQLFTGRYGISGLGGPVAMVQQAAATASEGWSIFLMLVAAISINIGLLNLLPLPALDGGRLIFLLVEALLGIKVREERQELIHAWGLMALLALMVLVTVKDVVGLL